MNLKKIIIVYLILYLVSVLSLIFFFHGPKYTWFVMIGGFAGSMALIKAYKDPQTLTRSRKEELSFIFVDFLQISMLAIGVPLLVALLFVL